MRQDTQCMDRIYKYGVPYYRIAREVFPLLGAPARVLPFFRLETFYGQTFDLPFQQGELSPLLYTHMHAYVYHR